MSRVWYGSLQNRLEEGRQFVEEITVGTGVTEYFGSDRHPYEVVEVTDQKHIKIRRMDHVLDGEPMTNSWKLVSNEDYSPITLVKRGKVWYTETVATPEDVIEAKRRLDEDHDPHMILWLAHNNFDNYKILETGKAQKRYHKMNISIGVAEYYYDYEY